MLQAYYTLSQTAQLCAAILNKIEPGLLSFTQVLDLCAGEGALSEALNAQHLSFTLVDANEEALENVKGSLERAKRYALTAEEWALTYAQERQFDLVVCNPPFGARAGSTKLGELVTQLHMPEVTQFEDYFLRLAVALKPKGMAFIMPYSALKPTAQSRQTLGLLFEAGYVPTHVYELPVDGFEGAVVQACLWYFKRRNDEHYWVEEVLARQAAKAFNAPFAQPVQTRDFSTAYGSIRGYARRECVSKRELKLTAQSYSQTSAPPLELGVQWQPEPKAIGALWTRLGCVYELTPTGWQPAQSQGYCDGVPVDQALNRALDACDYLKAGAVSLAAYLAQGLNIDELIARFGHLPNASMINYLPKSKSPTAAPGTQGTQALIKDVLRLGHLRLKASEAALCPQDDERIIALDRLELLSATAEVGLLAQLTLAGKILPKRLSERLNEAISTLNIPPSRLELRAAWIPKQIICKYSEDALALDQDGLYTYGGGASSSSERWQLRYIISWLNYNKGGQRIRQGDEANYQRGCALFAQHFAQAKTYDPLMRELALHWLAHQHQKTYVHLKTEDATSCALKLHPWQQEDQALAVSGQAMLCWDVGLGKTLGALSASISAHRGQAVFVVPKSVLEKWISELKRAYPHVSYARIGQRQLKNKSWVIDNKLIGEQLIKACFTKPVKALFMTHEVWARLEIDEATKRAAQREQAYIQHSSDSRTDALRRERYLVEAASKSFLFGGEFSYKDLPLASWLVVIDEAHQFKNLHAMPSGGWGSRLIAVGHAQCSKRAHDMKLKLDLLRQRGGKSLALSATPVTNSVIEIFNMLDIFSPASLERRGLLTAQQFIDTYCQIEDLSTLSWSGKLLEGQTIVGFRHIEDLQSMFQESMSFRTAVDVGLSLPSADEHFVRISPTPQIGAFIRAQQALLDEQILGERKQGEKLPHVFSILSTIDDVAAHPPLQGITEEHPKLEALLEKMMAHKGAGQLLFADRTESHEPLADAIAQRLSLKREQIAIINSKYASSMDKRLKIQDDFNRGKLKIIIGGKMMSEGLDLQMGTQAIHFLNLSWEENTIHQRKGRGIRQGNTCDTVSVYYYILEGSTDVYRQNLCTQKAGWFSELRSAQTESARISLFDDPMDPELIASLSAQPDEVIKSLKAQQVVATLDRAQRTLRQIAVLFLLRMNPGASQATKQELAFLELQLIKAKRLTPSMLQTFIQALHYLVSSYTRLLKQLPSDQDWQNAVFKGKSLVWHNAVSLSWDDEQEHPSLKCIDPEIELETYPNSFGAYSLAASQEHSASASASPLRIIIEEEHAPSSPALTAVESCASSTAATPKPVQTKSTPPKLQPKSQSKTAAVKPQQLDLFGLAS